MTAAEAAFAFLNRGLKRKLSLAQFATLAYLAIHGESPRLKVLSGIGRDVSSRNAEFVFGPLCRREMISQKLLTGKGTPGRGLWLYSITPLGLKALGLPTTQAASA